MMKQANFSRLILYGKDINELRNFYQQHFSFEVVEEIPGEWVVLKAGETERWYDDCQRLGIVHPNAHLEDKPWGVKEFYAVDPDGNLIKFGQVAFV